MSDFNSTQKHQIKAQSLERLQKALDALNDACAGENIYSRHIEQFAEACGVDVEELSACHLDSTSEDCFRSIGRHLPGYPHGPIAKAKWEGKELPIEPRKLEPEPLDYSQIEDVSVVNIDTKDYPDFVDAYIESATYMGREMTEQELEQLNEDSGYVYDKVQEHLY